MHYLLTSKKGKLLNIQRNGVINVTPTTLGITNKETSVFKFDDDRVELINNETIFQSDSTSFIVQSPSSGVRFVAGEEKIKISQHGDEVTLTEDNKV